MPLLLDPTDKEIAPALPLADWPVTISMLPDKPPDVERVLAPVLIVIVPESEPDSALVTVPVLRVIAPEPSEVAPSEAPVLIVMLPLIPEREVPEINVKGHKCSLSSVESVSPDKILTPPPLPLLEVPTARVIPPAVPHAAVPVARKISPLVRISGVAAPVESTKAPELELWSPMVAPVDTVIPPVPGLSPSVLAVPIVIVPDSPESESPDASRMAPPFFAFQRY